MPHLVDILAAWILYGTPCSRQKRFQHGPPVAARPVAPDFVLHVRRFCSTLYRP
jgi:hypothetical protein